MSNNNNKCWFTRKILNNNSKIWIIAKKCISPKKIMNNRVHKMIQIIINQILINKIKNDIIIYFNSKIFISLNENISF